MTITEIESSLNKLILNLNEQTFIYDFLLAYNTPKSVISRLQKGNLNLSKHADEIVIKKKLFFKAVTTADIDNILPLHTRMGFITNDCQQ